MKRSTKIRICHRGASILFYPAALPLSSRTLNYTAGVIRRYRTGDTVLVCETVEDLLSADPVLSDVDLRWPGVSLSGCELAEGTVQRQPRWPGPPSIPGHAPGAAGV